MLFQALEKYRDDFKNNEKRKAANPQLFLLNNPGTEQKALVLVAANNFAGFLATWFLETRLSNLAPEPYQEAAQHVVITGL